MFIEMESIENGIVQLISELGIRKLVMGAAADRHYSRYAYRNQKAFFGSLLMHIESILVDLSAVSLLNIKFLPAPSFDLQENDRSEVQESHLRTPRST